MQNRYYLMCPKHAKESIDKSGGSKSNSKKKDSEPEENLFWVGVTLLIFLLIACSIDLDLGVDMPHF